MEINKRGSFRKMTNYCVHKSSTHFKPVVQKISSFRFLKYNIILQRIPSKKISYPLSSPPIITITVTNTRKNARQTFPEIKLYVGLE